MNSSNFEDNTNIDLESLLEERKFSTLLGIAFLAIWILSLILIYNQR